MQAVVLEPKTNPFAPPGERADADAARRKEEELVLFTRGQVALAALFGGPMAGAGLIAWNFRVFGERSASVLWFCLGLGGNLVCFAMILMVPWVVPFGPFLTAFIMGALADSLQRSDVERFLARGAERRPWAVPVLIGILGLFFFVALFFVGLLLAGSVFAP